MKESSSLTKFRVMVNINGVMVKGIKANGKIIRCMVKAVWLGKMESNTKAILKRIKDMVKVYSNGKMEEFMMDLGLMAGKVVLVIIINKMEPDSKGFGLKEKDKNG